MTGVLIVSHLTVLLVAVVLIGAGAAAGVVLVDIADRRPDRVHVREIRALARLAVQRRPWADTNHKTLPVQDRHIDRSGFYPQAR